MTEQIYTGVLLDPEYKCTSKVEISEKDFLDECKDLIRCEYIDMCSVGDGGVRYIAIVDDMGLLKNRPVSIECSYFQLHGPTIILGNNGEGDARSLCETEMLRMGTVRGNGTAVMYKPMINFNARDIPTAEEAEEYFLQLSEECLI